MPLDIQLLIGGEAGQGAMVGIEINRRLLNL